MVAQKRRKEKRKCEMLAQIDWHHIVTAGLVQMEKCKYFYNLAKKPSKGAARHNKPQKQAVGEHSKSPASSSLASSKEANRERERERERESERERERDVGFPPGLRS